MSRNACLAPKDARAYRKTDAVCVSARAALRNIPQDFPKRSSGLLSSLASPSGSGNVAAESHIMRPRQGKEPHP